MIPGKIINFLEQEATVAVAGTRDKHLIPHIHRVSGWSLGPDQQTISCLIPEEYASDLISSLEDNGQFALTVEQIGSHETYQFKGQYVDSRLINEADIAVFERCREQFARIVSVLFGLSEDACGAYILKPRMVISFKVREIFLQTPGPGAGQRLVSLREK